MQGRHLSIGSRYTTYTPALGNRFVPVSLGAPAPTSASAVRSRINASITQSPLGIGAPVGGAVFEATSIVEDEHLLPGMARVGARMEPIGKAMNFGKGGSKGGKFGKGGHHDKGHGKDDDGSKERHRDRNHDGRDDNDHKKKGHLKNNNAAIGADITLDDTDSALRAMGMTPDVRTAPPIGASLIGGEWLRVGATPSGDWTRVSVAEAQQPIGARRRNRSRSRSRSPSGEDQAEVIIKNRSPFEINVNMSRKDGLAVAPNILAGSRARVFIKPSNSYLISVSSEEGGKAFAHSLHGTVIRAGRLYVLRVGRRGVPTLRDATRNRLNLVRGEVAADADAELMQFVAGQLDGQELVGLRLGSTNSAVVIKNKRTVPIKVLIFRADNDEPVKAKDVSAKRKGVLTLAPGTYNVKMMANSAQFGSSQIVVRAHRAYVLTVDSDGTSDFVSSSLNLLNLVRSEIATEQQEIGAPLDFLRGTVTFVNRSPAEVVLSVERASNNQKVDSFSIAAGGNNAIKLRPREYTVRITTVNTRTRAMQETGSLRISVQVARWHVFTIGEDGRPSFALSWDGRSQRVRSEIATDAAPAQEVRGDLRFEPYTAERAAQALASGAVRTQSRVGWSITPLSSAPAAPLSAAPLARPIANMWTVSPIGASAAPTPSAGAAVKPIHSYRLADLTSSQRALVRLDIAPGTLVTVVSPSGERVPLGAQPTPVGAGIHDLEIKAPGKAPRTLPGAVVLHAGSEYVARREGRLLAVSPEEQHSATRLAQYAPALKPVANSVLIVDQALNISAVAPISSFLQIQSDDYTLKAADGREWAVSPDRLVAWGPSGAKSSVRALFPHPADPSAHVLVLGK